MEWVRGAFAISTEESRLDIALIHAYLKSSYWAADIPYEVVQRSVNGSLPFGVYRGASQIGFARVITDRATFAYLADVFIDERYQGQGLGEWLVATVLGHPDLQGLRRWLLMTRDAHGLYRKFGFDDLRNPTSVMERHDPDIYRQGG